jgi:riboflavin-specific deaminase-like protein
MISRRRLTTDNGQAKLQAMKKVDEILRKYSETGLPFVTVKYAQSLDGRIATSEGDSQWISSQASLKFAHALRRDHDAVMVGIGTVLKDDPRLTVRLVGGRDPLRVVIDSRLRIPLDANVLADGNARNTLIIAGERAAGSRARRLERLGAQVLQVGSESDGRVNLSLMLDALAQRGIRSALVEGGGAIITSFLRAKLVDRLIAITTPKIIGRGTEAIGDLGITRLRDAMTFSSVVIRRRGTDVIFDCRF